MNSRPNLLHLISLEQVNFTGIDLKLMITTLTMF
jgi:hypothetical protein